MQPCLDSLEMTEDQLQAAKERVREMAYFKWQAAGCPQYDGLTFGCDAELEWIEYYYLPTRQPSG